MDDFKDYFKNLGTGAPYGYALAPAIFVALVSNFYVSKYEFGSLKVALVLGLVFYVALFATLMYIHNAECKDGLNNAAKQAAMEALAPTVVLMAVIGGMGSRDAEWNNGKLIHKTALAYVASVFSVNYALVNCKEDAGIYPVM